MFSTAGCITADGIWSGLFIGFAGALAIIASYFEKNKFLRIGALMMCIIALLTACFSGLVNLTAFG